MHLNFIFLIIFLIYYLLLKYDKRLFYGLRIKNVEGLLEISVLTNIFNKKCLGYNMHMCVQECVQVFFIQMWLYPRPVVLRE